MTQLGLVDSPACQCPAEADGDGTTSGADDKDGLTNLQEFLWLTNPMASNVISPALQTAPDLSITWPSAQTRESS